MDVDKFKYDVPCDFSRWKEQCTWILEHFGPIGQRWDYDRSNFHFASEHDRLLFQIGWV